MKHMERSNTGLPANFAFAKTCQKDGCNDPAARRSYCGDYYRQMYRPGTSANEIGLTTSPGRNKSFVLPTDGANGNILRAAKTSLLHTPGETT